jgi:hypothetical protein
MYFALKNFRQFPFSEIKNALMGLLLWLHFLRQNSQSVKKSSFASAEETPVSLSS